MKSNHILQKNGIDLIAAERQRQLSVEGYTSEHDGRHALGELIDAASAYGKVALYLVSEFKQGTAEYVGRKEWPWGQGWFKPSSDPIRNLEKAGALIAAEIDRLLRLKAREDKSVSYGGGEHASEYPQTPAVIRPVGSTATGVDNEEIAKSVANDVATEYWQNHKHGYPGTVEAACIRAALAALARKSKSLSEPNTKVLELPGGV